MVTSIATLREAKDPEHVFQSTVDASPRLRALLVQASPVEPFRVAADYSYVRREFAGPRYLLAGDAAVFYDPIFSSGVYLSTNSAQLAVAAIARAEAGGRALTAGERRRYTRELKAHSAVFRALIAVFYNNDSFAVFMTQKPPLDLNRGLISIVAGHARLTWPLWWRFRVFLLVCRIQKFLPLCKRIEQTARVSLRPA
jgi:2-polyprenyl-6-methoxyphenol hydroxylase-like FAD-dependent oxidoreductase